MFRSSQNILVRFRSINTQKTIADKNCNAREKKGLKILQKVSYVWSPRRTQYVRNFLFNIFNPFFFLFPPVTFFVRYCVLSIYRPKSH